MPFRDVCAGVVHARIGCFGDCAWVRRCCEDDDDDDDERTEEGKEKCRVIRRERWKNEVNGKKKGEEEMEDEYETSGNTEGEIVSDSVRILVTKETLLYVHWPK